MQGAYHTVITAVEHLSPVQTGRMAELYLSYYNAADERMFLSDLRNKTKALLLYHVDTLVGFTTFEVYERVWRDERIAVVYSGDTIVEQAHWGQQALAHGWIGYIAGLRKEKGAMPIYWFLIVKGHRTFKYLPAFTHLFYPHWSGACDHLKPLLDTLAEEKFGSDYDKERGIISFPRSKGHLKEAYAYPRENELSNASVQFFLEKNPGYLVGDELACLCSFDDANLRPLTKRILYANMEKS